MTVALGITTFNRPAYLEKCLRAIRNHAASHCKAVAVFNDGSDSKHAASYRRAYEKLPDATVFEEPLNHGVAYAKNRLLEWAFTQGTDYVILCEDDIIVKAPEAVTEYAAVAKRRGIAHLSFAHHGPANHGGPVRVDGSISYYPHSIGAWSLFNRQCLLEHGTFDENFHNAWEHVEHEMRLINAGCMLAAGPMCYPDVTGSEQWLTEIPGSIEKSSIRPRADWHSNIRDGLLYWRDNKPETYAMLFGPSKPLEQYALSVTG